MTKKLMIFFSICLLSRLSNAEALIEKDISINSNTLYFSKSIPFSYCFNYQEECTQAISGEEISFSVEQRAVFRWETGATSGKSSFSPFMDNTSQSPPVYQFELSSDYFPYTTLHVRFVVQQGVTAHSCEVLVVDGLLSESMQSRLVSSLADQGIHYERYNHYMAIPCGNEA